MRCISVVLWIATFFNRCVAYEGQFVELTNADSMKLCRACPTLDFNVFTMVYYKGRNGLHFLGNPADVEDKMLIFLDKNKFIYRPYYKWYTDYKMPTGVIILNTNNINDINILKKPKKTVSFSL